MIPVIAIDGPTASGKGTVAQRVARELGFHYLDSGALYRIVGLASQKQSIDLTDHDGLGEFTRGLKIVFDQNRVLLGDEDVSEAIRSEEMGRRASTVGAIPSVRHALLSLQKSFLLAPGLVADGRDMGSVIFPEAVLKVFLTAKVEIRAERRYKQLIAKGISANIENLTRDLIERDQRDTQRTDAPLVQCEGALLLDTTDQSVDQATHQILEWYQMVLRNMS
jgi:cytidylate kinase